MTKEKDKLIEEIKENARKDRRRLEKLCDSIMDMPSSEEFEVGDMDPAVGAAISENITMLTEALTKSNAQLVEIAKLEAKIKLLDKEEGLTEKDSIFDDIDAAHGIEN